MASNTTQGYQPIAPIDWKDLLQSLAACCETAQTDHPQNKSPGIDVKSKAGRIGNYIADLEYCLHRANFAVGYYENLVKNYDRLVAVMEESRNQAYDTIVRLKDEISLAKKYHPLRMEKEDTNE
jgi:membrane-bound lytic murein transglycosylase MltF